MTQMDEGFVRRAIESAREVKLPKKRGFDRDDFIVAGVVLLATRGLYELLEWLSH